MFADTAQIQIKAGDGGNGHVGFRREKFVSKGGPDGGDGGDGGDVVFRASTSQNTLVNFRHQKTLKAQPGDTGQTRNKHGRKGKDLIVDVPVGTLVLDAESGAQLADLTADGQEALIGKGGQGGFGNAHFKSSVRQAPMVAEKGTPGQLVDLSLELKLIADVGLVGLPNAGKSTFLSVVSNARPKIANYPFTTLTPNLGVVDRQYGGYLIADIPGLIEGASEGKGLGHDFLRHVERTSVLVHLIDAWSEDVLSDYKVINKELQVYSDKVSKLPAVVVLSKIDGMPEADLKAKAKLLNKDKSIVLPVLHMSSVTRTGLQEVLTQVSEVLEANKNKIAEEVQVADAENVYKLNDSDYSAAWQVVKKRKKYIVTGAKIERFAYKTNFGDYHAEERLQDIMSRIGIIHELDRQGYDTDEVVIFGDPEIGRMTL